MKLKKYETCPKCGRRCKAYKGEVLKDKIIQEIIVWRCECKGFLQVTNVTKQAYVLL